VPEIFGEEPERPVPETFGEEPERPMPEIFGEKQDRPVSEICGEEPERHVPEIFGEEPERPVPEIFCEQPGTDRFLSQYFEFPLPIIISPILPARSSIAHQMDNGPIRGCSSTWIVAALNLRKFGCTFTVAFITLCDLTELSTEPTVNSNCMEHRTF
jgi:hypothetical protein